MALQKKILSLPFNSGLDEKSSFVTSQPGALSNAENASMLKTGQISKRNGYSIHRDSESADDGKGGTTLYRFQNGTAIGMFKDQMVVSDGQQLYTEYASGALKRSGDFLNCEFKNESVYNADSKKVGAFKLQQYTINSKVYNFVTWVEVTPVGPLTGQAYVIYAGIQEDDTKAWVRDPIIVDSVTRQSLNYKEGISRLPSLHLQKIGTDAYIVYSIYDSGSSKNKIKIARVEMNSLPNWIGAAPITKNDLLDNAGTPAVLQCDEVLSSISVESVDDSGSEAIFVAFHLYASPSVTTVKLARYRQSDINGGTYSAHQYVDVTTTVNMVKSSIQNDGFAIVPGLACRVDPDDTHTNKLSVYYTREASKTGSYKVSSTAFDPSSLSISPVTFDFDPNDGAILHNATHVQVGTSSEAYYYLTVIHQPINASPSPLNNHSGLDEDSDTGGLLEIADITCGSGHSSPTTDFIVDITPAGGGAATSAKAKLYLGYSESIGSHGGFTVSILEPGSGFEYNLSSSSSNTEKAILTSAEQTNLETAINTALSPSHAFTYGGSFVNLDKTSVKPLAHTVYAAFGDRASTGQKSSYVLAQNATLVCDAMKFNAFDAKSGVGSGLGKTPYVVISRTNADGADFNTVEYLVRPDTTTTGNILYKSIVGATVSTQGCLNLTDDYQARISANYRLLDGISRVSQTGASGLGTVSKFAFGSNRLATEGFFAETQNTTATTMSEKYKDQTYTGSITELNLDPDRDHKFLDVGNALLGSGGVLYSYDGVDVVENGFYEYPGITTLVGSASNYLSRLSSAKTYSVSFTYDYVDAQGNIHFSVNTPIQQVELGANDSIIIARVYSLDLTTKYLKTRVTMYRSGVNEGPLLKKVSSILMDSNDSVITFIDRGETEEEYEELPVIYTTGGVLPNYQPGCVTDLIEHKGRVFVTTPTEFVRFSKPLRQGEVSGYPLPQFVIDVPGDAGEITGVESNINFLTLFTRNNVFAVQGDGPNAIGQGSFTRPSLIGAGKGAVPGSPHLSHAFGTFYVADRGIYLVTTNGQIQYVGAPVEDLVDTYGVKDITVFDYQNEIRFAGESLDGTNVVMLVYNTFFKQWTNWTIQDSTSDAFAGQVFDGSGGDPKEAHYILKKSGKIIRQSSTLFRDQTALSPVAYSQYNLDITLNNLSMAGLQSVQRVYRMLLLFQELNQTTFRIYLTDDRGNTDTYSILANAFPTDQLRIHLSNQKSRYVKARIRCSASVSDYEGVTLNGIAFEVGARAGTFKLPSAQTAQEI